MSTRRIAAVLFLLPPLATASLAAADVASLVPDRDNTLVEEPAGALSMGKSFHFYAGRVGTNGEGTRRRGVIHFDVAGSIPARSTISAVSLKLYMAQSSTGTQNVVLKRMLADWGEGLSFGFGGYGEPAKPGDATWLHTFWPSSLWGAAGGDFSATISATKSVGGVGFYTWSSTSALVADVQGWLDSPTTNFGWLVQGNESVMKTVKKFSSRDSDNPAYVPVLTVTYAPPPPCAAADQNCDGVVDGADLGLLLAVWGSADAKGDLNDDGVVDGADLGALLADWD